MNLTFTFLGTGTSQGIPMIACDCYICTSSDPRDKRLRTSGLLRSDEGCVVFDTGPDFREQMLREKVKGLDAVVFTHQHKDHTAGLDDVRAFNYFQHRDMPVFGTPAVHDHLRREFYYIFEAKDYPGIPKLDLQEIDPERPFEIKDLRLTPIPMLHGKLPVLGYRCGDFAYLTDVNHIPDSSYDLLEGVKCVVISALRHQTHYSHFTLEEALEALERMQPEQAYLTHISHQLGAHAEVEKLLPPHVKVGYDGLTLDLTQWS